MLRGGVASCGGVAPCGGAGDQLRQVLSNLTRNALVHTPAGTAVQVSVTRAGVHAIVTAHGGTVAAETRTDGGAAFTVELPAHDT